MTAVKETSSEARRTRQADFSREAGERATGCPNAEDYLGPMRRLHDEAWERGEIHLFAWCLTRVLASLLFVFSDPSQRGSMLRWVGANCAEFAAREEAEEELREKELEGIHRS